MKRGSISESWNSTSGFWRFIYITCFLLMPWTIFILIFGIWHLDSRIDDLQDSLECKNIKSVPNENININFINHQKTYPCIIDTIEKCR